MTVSHMEKPRALLIAEKPSLAKTIEEVIKKHQAQMLYDIKCMSLRGHIFSVLMPNELDPRLAKWEWDTLPIDPEQYGGWRNILRNEPHAKNQRSNEDIYKDILREVKSGRYQCIINAGDPDQEGELLVQEVIRALPVKLPVKRFWTNDLTEGAVLNALTHLRDDDNDRMLKNLYAAACGRQRSDWMFGLNGSRAVGLKLGVSASVGRVETAQLNIVCKREEEIRNFVPHTVYGVKAEYTEGWAGTLFNKDKISYDKEERDKDKVLGIVWFETRQEAQSLINGIPDKGTVISCTEKTGVKTQPPKLFKLSTIQHEAGKLGFGAEKTLSILESLYLKKLTSYPRTGCEYISSHEDVMSMLRAAAAVPELAPYVSRITQSDIDRVRSSNRWMNDAAAAEEGHTGLCPTTNVPNMNELSADEKTIYTLLARQFVSIFLPPLVQNKVQIIVDIGGHLFRSNGTRVVDKGYTSIFGRNLNDTILPIKKTGDIVDIRELILTEKTSQCPKRYTSAELVSVCEAPYIFLEDERLKKLKPKIGTPATRADIIRKLIDSKTHPYLREIQEGTKKNARTVLQPTPEGELLIKNLDGCMLTKVDMTGYLQEELDRVKAGTLTLDEFYKDVVRQVTELVQEIKEKEMTPIKQRIVIGQCSNCGNDILEGSKMFYCSGYKKDGSGCNFLVWKNQFSKEEARVLASGETIRKTLLVQGQRTEDEFVYDWEKNEPVVVGDTSESIGKCPLCGKANVLASKYKYTCDVCGFRTSRTFGKYTIQPQTFMKMLGGECFQIKVNGQPASITFVKELKRIGYVMGHSDVTCPCCKEQKLVSTDVMFECKSCGFKLWRNQSGHLLTEEEAASLCTNGKVGPVRGMRDKHGKPFKTAPYILLDKSGKTSYDFGKQKQTRKRKSKGKTKQKYTFEGLDPEEFIKSLTRP